MPAAYAVCLTRAADSNTPIVRSGSASPTRPALIFSNAMSSPTFLALLMSPPSSTIAVAIFKASSSAKPMPLIIRPISEANSMA